MKSGVAPDASPGSHPGYNRRVSQGRARTGNRGARGAPYKGLAAAS
ncbi:hypothetical protein SAMN03159511_3724 [Pseudomonas sp. NFACC19-2]|nr:hypothetical protein SAMN03159511_3724 [Pseudomonas sp. NFACC19-2]